MSAQPVEYRIETVNDFLQVPEDRIVGAKLPFFIWVDDGQKNIAVNLLPAEIIREAEK